MPPKSVVITLDWNTRDATQFLEFLEKLQESIWTIYHDNIVELEIAKLRSEPGDDAVLEVDLDNPIPF